MKSPIKILLILLVSTTLFLLIAERSYAQQVTGQLFEKALYTEEVEGDLTAAIAIYHQILEENPDNRQMAARALLHVGLCYEKLGRNEATKAYQQLVNNFPDQKSEVAIAKERLSSLILIAEQASKTPLVPKDMTDKRIWQGKDVDDSGEISPDGKYLSYINWNTGELALYEIASGKSRRLTHNNSAQIFMSKMTP